MPCNTDYMDPSTDEIRVSRIACLIDELNGTPINKTHWKGYHPAVYCQSYDKYAGKYSEAEMVSLLIEKIQSLHTVTECSLELQMWWRDYQEKEAATKGALKRKEALAQQAREKLTEEELAALLGVVK